MIELSNEETRDLLGFLNSTRSFLRTVEGVGDVPKIRNDLINRGGEYLELLLRKLGEPAARHP